MPLVTLSKRPNITNTYIGAIDIDHFKVINDTYGHLNGNIVLHTFSKKLKHEIDKAFAPNCFVYRFGGDEFSIVIFNANPEQIIAALNNVEQYFRDNFIKLPDNKTKIQFSFSCGFTKHLSNEHFYNALERIMLQLADYKKEVYRFNDGNYEVKLYYNKGDEGQMIGRILSFGSYVKVKSPDSVVRQIVQKVSEQLKAFTKGL